MPGFASFDYGLADSVVWRLDRLVVQEARDRGDVIVRSRVCGRELATAGVMWTVQLLREIGFLEWVSGGASTLSDSCSVQ